MSAGWGRGRGRWEGTAVEAARAAAPSDEAHVREILFRGAGLPVFEGLAPEEWEEALGDGRSVTRTGERHISTSVVAFLSHAREALVLWHRKAGEWVYPGGHPDGDWNLLRSALRELAEETGLEVGPGATIWHPIGTPASIPPLVQAIPISERGEGLAHAHLDAVYFVSLPTSARESVRPSEAESGSHRWVAAVGGKGSPLDALPGPTRAALRFLRDEVLPTAQRAEAAAGRRSGL